MKPAPVIQTTARKTLVGHQIATSFAVDRTAELWRGFMPLRGKIKERKGNELYSVALYPSGFFDDFNSEETFVRWAAVEVTTDEVPEGFEMLEIPGGTYAVFTYRGHPAKAEVFFSYIFREWLPSSGYRIDDRPFFELLGERYRNDSDDSEEDIYIPVRPV